MNDENRPLGAALDGAGRRASDGTAVTVVDPAHEGIRRRNVGMQIVEDAADVEVRAAIDRAIARLAATGEPFTSDDVRAVDEGFGSPNLLGARINRAARHGEIVRVGFVRTARPEAHGRHVSQWQGVT